MMQKTSVILLFILFFLLSACAPDAPQIESSSAPEIEALPEVEAQHVEQTSVAEALEPTLAALPVGGYLDVLITMDLEGVQQCLATYPFVIRQQDGRILLTGEGQVMVDCHFEGTNCTDACVTWNIDLLLESRVDGEILPAENGDGELLNLYYFYDGEMLQYFSDYPEDTPMTFTETMPSRQAIAELVPASMPFSSGANVQLMGAGNTAPSDSLSEFLDVTRWEVTINLK